MSKLMNWLGNAISNRRAIDQLFEKVDDKIVFDSGNIAGKVCIEGEEATAIKHSLYLLNLLPWVTTFPALVLLMLFFRDAIPLPLREPIGGAGFTLAFFLGVVARGALIGLLLSLPLLLRPLYVAVAVRGKTTAVYTPDVRVRKHKAEGH